MDIHFSNQRNNLIVIIDGDVDHHSSEMIRQAVDAMYFKTRAKNIIFDFSRVGFMDSSGIGVIIGRYRLAENSGGKVMIARLHPEMTRLFELSGLRRIVSCFDTIDDAVKSV